MNDESIRVLQFDYSQSSGVSIVDVNNVHSESSKNSHVDQVCLLMKEDMSVATEPDTASLENSFNSSVMVEADIDGDGKPLMVEDSEHVSKPTKAEKRASVMGTFKAVSKLLATPNARRRSAVKMDKLGLTTANLHI